MICSVPIGIRYTADIDKARAILLDLASRNLKAKTGDGKLENIYEDFNEDLVIVTFEQDYQSNNLSNQMKKQQY